MRYRPGGGGGAGAGAVVPNGADYDALILADPDLVGYWNMLTYMSSVEPRPPVEDLKGAVDGALGNHVYSGIRDSLGFGWAVHARGTLNAAISEQWINFGDNFDFPGNAPYTLEGWFIRRPGDPDENAWHALWSKYGSSGNISWFLGFHAQNNNLGFFRFDSANNSDSLGSPVLADGLHLFDVTYDGANLRMMIDGALVAGPVASARAGTNGDAACLISGFSQFTNQQTFHGQTSRFAVYNEAKTLEEHQARYAAGVA